MKSVRSAVGAAVGGLVFALPVVVAPSALAADRYVAPSALAADRYSYNQCPANSACMFEHANGGGLVFAINKTRGGKGEDSNFHDNPCVSARGDCRSSKHRESNGTWGDQASSVYNRLNRRFCFFKHTGFRGSPREVMKIQAGQKTNLPRSFNDEFSSGRPC